VFAELNDCTTSITKSDTQFRFPHASVKYCLETLKQMLSEPNADSPVEPEVAEMYRDNHNLFTKTAKEWTKEHAGGE